MHEAAPSPKPKEIYITGSAETAALYRQGREGLDGESQDRLINRVDAGVFGVLDGLGAHRDSGLAADLVIETVDNAIDTDPTFASHTSEEALDWLVGVMDQSAKNISESYYGGSTAATLVRLVDGPDGKKMACWVSVADTRLYVVRDGDIRQITTDEGFGNVVDNAIGRKFNGVRSDNKGIFEVEPGDRLILLTDGVTGDYEPDLRTPEEIGGAVSGRTPQEAADKLLEIATKNDDRAALVVDIPSTEPEMMSDAPTGSPEEGAARQGDVDPQLLAIANKLSELVDVAHGGLEGLQLLIQAASVQHESNQQALAMQLQREEAAQRAAREAAERREARPQWVKDLEADLEQAASNGEDLGPIVMTALIERAQTVTSNLSELNFDNYGKDHFDYIIQNPETGLPERGAVTRRTTRKWYGRKVTERVVSDLKKTLIFTSKGRVAHPQASGHDGAPVEAIAFDPQTGELYSCKGNGAQLLGVNDIKRLYLAAGQAKPKKWQDYLGVAVSAMTFLSDNLDTLSQSSRPYWQTPSPQSVWPNSRNAWGATPRPAYGSEDDEPTVVIQ